MDSSPRPSNAWDGNDGSSSRVPTPALPPSPAHTVTVYWRPGCPYCASLRRGLRRAGLATNEVNIWTDRQAAATVRHLAGGNETVPTVVVGDAAFVNPSAAEVLAASGDTGALRIGAPTPSRWRPGASVAVLQWLVIAALVAASFALDGSGHAGLSWALDGVAVAVYLAIRTLRGRI